MCVRKHDRNRDVFVALLIIPLSVSVSILDEVCPGHRATCSAGRPEYLDTRVIALERLS